MSKYKPGQSGNPGGRPKLRYQTVMRHALNERITQEEADSLVNIWITEIKKGTKLGAEYMKLLIERCIVIPKEERLQLPFAGKDARGMMEALAKAVENGDITSTELSNISSSIAKLHEVTDVKPLKEMLAEVMSIVKK